MNLINSIQYSHKVPTDIFSYIYQSELIQNLLEQEQRFGESHLGGKNRIALFDLDNTLIVGDIGDAVFAQLLIDGLPLPLSWKEYRSMCKENPDFAYVEAVRALEGISMEYIIRVSKRLLQSNQDYLYCEGEAVSIPKPNLLMMEVVRLLRDWNYLLFVVSASNDISAKVAGSVLFDIPINNIAGIKPKLLGDKLTNTILDPIPIGVGKVAQYRLMCGDNMPMIVATDSMLDLPILEICDPDGLAIIVGENEALYLKAKENLTNTIRIHQVPSDILLLFQQQHRVA
jgi:phosphoserine phosphatase